MHRKKFSVMMNLPAILLLIRYATVPFYKIANRDTIYDITDYLRPGTGTYFFLPDGTPITLNVTYTKTEAFKAEERCLELKDELEMTRRQLQNTEKVRQEEEKKRKEAERRRLINYITN